MNSAHLPKGVVYALQQAVGVIVHDLPAGRQNLLLLYPTLEASAELKAPVSIK